MKKEAITHGVLDDLANRNDNWDKLDGVIERVTELDESRQTLTNLIVNGDFSDGTDGWVGQNGFISVENKILSLKVTNKVVASRIEQESTVSEINNTYYMVGKIKPKYANLTRFQFGLIYANVSVIPDVFNKVSTIISTGNVGPFRLYHSTATNYVDDDIIYFEDIQLINLTQTFGAGNEPTKEEMDIIMDTIGYFNGAHTITSKEQFNVLLKMVRENTLATTSLGGGF